MRASIIAVAALTVVAAGAYAGMNALLPAPVQRAFDVAAESLGAAKPSGGAAAKPAPKPKAASARPVPVETAQARAESVASRFATVGSLMSEESVQIAAEQPGRLVAIHFKEGDRVRAGDPVLKLDDSLLLAELKDLEARLTLAEANLKRASTLSRSGYATDTARDQAVADRATAQAAVELAKVRLAKTEIRAPFDGVVGFRLASVGAYVQAGQSIVNLENVATLKVDFRVPEARLAEVRPGLEARVTVDAYPERAFSSRIYAIDPQVDVNGRALRVRARLDNTDGLLRPGLFARVEVQAEERHDVVLAPESALNPRGSESFVYRVVNGRAVETPVRLGARRAGEVEIVSGLSLRDVVVVAGHQFLRDGASVEVVEAARQAAVATPGATRIAP